VFVNLTKQTIRQEPEIRFWFDAPNGIWCDDCTESRRGSRNVAINFVLHPEAAQKLVQRIKNQESKSDRSPLRCTKKALGRAAAPTPPARPPSAQSNGVI
jgi:hypothetical protein